MACGLQRASSEGDPLLGGNVMKVILMFLAVLFGAATLGWRSQEAQGPAATPQPSSRTEQAAQAARAPPKQQDVAQAAEGDISRVDAQKMLLWIKTADGKEMQFSYAADTPVYGGSNSVEGLSSLSGKGTHVKVTYES